ncbi:MAG: lytic murein transglycosylase [Alphaproteobacteria bacterium]|nr:lytic murein transglycosylase [Alphaproteobacteria bacterium]
MTFRHKPVALTALALGACLVPMVPATTFARPRSGGPVIHIEDVARFYRIYDAAGGKPTASELQRDYIDKGSPGLRHLAQIRHVTGVLIAGEIASHPQIYANAKRCMAVLPRVRRQVAAALHRLGHLYPQAVFPPVTIAVSHGKPVGVADASGVMIGLEGLCAVRYLGANLDERFVHTIAHEYIHVQQAVASPALYNDPKPTVLDASLIEGAAEFMATLIAGEADFCSPYAPVDRARRKPIEIRFVAAENKTGLRDWIDNGTLTTPGDLGYWVGYRIVKSYYEHTADRRAAVRDIIEMKHPRSFLARSGWYPGIRLSPPVF